MKQAVVTDWQGASFKGIDISPWVMEWHDTRASGVVVHEYIKRDGGEGEAVGRPPHEAQVTLCFVGANWRNDYLALQQAIDAGPIGDFVHPVLGAMRAACFGPSMASMVIADGVDTYTVPLRFLESAVDSKAPSPLSKGPEAANSDVNDANDQLTQDAAPWTANPTSTTAVAIASLQSAAVGVNGYAAAALAASTTLIPDSALSSLLDAARLAGQSARDALLADVSVATATNDAAKYAVLADIEQLYAACVALDDAVRSQRPRTFDYTLVGCTHIANLARLFYGSDGVDRIDEILMNNADKIADPGMIPAGTTLTMAVPTIAIPTET